MPGGGASRFQAAVDAARLRLRPIRMTSFAFILGVFPLVPDHSRSHTKREAQARAGLGVALACDSRLVWRTAHLNPWDRE